MTSPDAMTWTSDTRPRRRLTLTTHRSDDEELTLDVEEPTPGQVTEALTAFGALTRDSGRRL